MRGMPPLGQRARHHGFVTRFWYIWTHILGVEAIWNKIRVRITIRTGIPSYIVLTLVNSGKRRQVLTQYFSGVCSMDFSVLAVVTTRRCPMHLCICFQ